MDLHWEERGTPDGPLLVVSMHFSAPPTVFEGLWADIGRDHRVVTYHLRGLGKSPRGGPYDMDTDARDLIAVAEAAGGGPATVVAFGDGAHRAVRAALDRPDLIARVVAPGGNPVTRQAGRDGPGLASSAGVLELLQEQIARDYRGALRTIVSSANPQYDEDAVRERVELNVDYCPQEAAVARLANWIEDDLVDASRRLGDRLWIFFHPNNPWFPPELAETTRQLAPEAHVVEIEEGPVTRPDLHAAVIREATRTT